MKYWDSSAIVPLLISEPHSKAAAAALSADCAIATWWATPVECVSALARREREGLLDSRGMTQAMKRLAVLREHWLEVEASTRLRDVAVRLLRTHPLRAADALQLAACMVVAESLSETDLICCDQRLLEAAEREGIAGRSLE